MDTFYLFVSGVTVDFKSIDSVLYFIKITGNSIEIAESVVIIRSDGHGIDLDSVSAFSGAS